MNNICGSIYILTNPSFPDYVKIGYSKNVVERINKLNNSFIYCLLFFFFPHTIIPFF